MHNYNTFSAVLPAARAFFAAGKRGYSSSSLTAGEGLKRRRAELSLSESESGSKTLEEASSASAIAFSTLARAPWCFVRQVGGGGGKRRTRYDTNNQRSSSFDPRHVRKPATELHPVLRHYVVVLVWGAVGKPLAMHGHVPRQNLECVEAIDI